MRVFLLSIFLLLLFSVFFLVSAVPKHKYDIAITFCDSRPPVSITIESCCIPDTDEGGVSYYLDQDTRKKYINVCDIKTIKVY
jgi:hypothetical protein